MKVRLHINKEIEVEIKNDEALMELDNFYRTHAINEWSKLDETLIDKAVEVIKAETGLPVFDEESPIGKENITAVYAMDGNAILEW